MSAFGYKQTFGEVSDYVRFTPESGHWLSPRQHELDQPIVVGELQRIATDIAVISGFHRPSEMKGTAKRREATVDVRLGFVSTEVAVTPRW